MWTELEGGMPHSTTTIEFGPETVEVRVEREDSIIYLCKTNVSYYIIYFHIMYIFFMILSSNKNIDIK